MQINFTRTIIQINFTKTNIHIPYYNQLFFLLTDYITEIPNLTTFSYYKYYSSPFFQLINFFKNLTHSAFFLFFLFRSTMANLDPKNGGNSCTSMRTSFKTKKFH